MIPNLVIKVPSTLKCRKYTYNYPDVSPSISQIYPDVSLLGAYTVVSILGNNFSLDGPNGYSTVTFGSIKNIPVTFLSSMNLSFVVPVTGGLVAGIKNVQVVNNIYPTSLYSNVVTYTLS
jgi:hypothetical protein